MMIEKLIEIIQKNRVVIYGVGQYATIFVEYLNFLGLRKCIDYFLVSDLGGNQTMFYNKPVKQFSDCKNNLEDTVLVIAVNQQGRKEINELLYGVKIKETFVLEKEHMRHFSKGIYERFKDSDVQRNKVFVECSEGMGYRCNCKYIVEGLKNLDKINQVEVVWSVRKIEKDIPSYIKQVKRYTYEYFKELYTSGIYIGNDGHSPYIEKRKEQYYINTWHGSGPFKKVGTSLFEGDVAKQKEFEELFSIVDLFVSNTRDNTQMFRESFGYHGEVYECGSPRNDVFFQENNFREAVCEKLGIDNSKKLLLYAPTFRDRGECSFQSYDLDMKKILDALENRFGEKFVLLYRFHRMLYKYEQGKDFYPDAVNVTLYPDVQELLVASDVLITDYSSTMWDFSLQDRPIFLYHNDEKEYANDRGFYCPPSQWPYPQAHSNEEMVEIIRKFDEEKYFKDLHVFIKKYKSFDDGYASERVVERIMDVIEHPKKYGKE